MRFLLLSILISAFAVGCAKTEVRVDNEFYRDLPNFKIGTVEYDTVKTGTTTEYREIEEGNHDIYINDKVTGNISFNTNIFTRSSQWTLVVKNDSLGTYELQED